MRSACRHGTARQASRRRDSASHSLSSHLACVACGCRACGSPTPGRTALLQAFEPALALDDVLVVPLDIAGLAEPTLQRFDIDLGEVGVAGFGGLEAALVLQAGLVERLPAPEQQSHAVFQQAVA